MAAHTFTTGCRIVWHATVYTVTRQLMDGQLNLEAVDSGRVMTVFRTHLETALFAGDLTFAQTQSYTPAASTSSWHYPTLSDCPPELRAVATYRWWAIEPLTKMTKRTRADVTARVTTIRQQIATGVVPNQTQLNGRSLSVSIMSLYRWLKLYKEAGNDQRALIPATKQQGGKGKHRLEPPVERMLTAIVAKHVQRPERFGIDDIYAELYLQVHEHNQQTNERLAAPSLRTIARRVAQVDVHTRLEVQQGKRAMRDAQTQYGQMVLANQPLECVEIDHTRIDLIVVDEATRNPLGRPTLTACIDTVTRYPLGYYLGFEPPGYHAVMACLFAAFQPKGNVQQQYRTQHTWQAYGLPRSLVIDNGKEFVGRDLEDACQQLGIVLQYTPERTPQLKPFIERYFQTLNSGLFHKLPGTTFESPQVRGNYDSVGNAKVTLSELDRLLHIFLLDIYAERFHTGLGAIPARRWEQFIAAGFAPRLPASQHELAVLLGRVAERTIQHYGIELFGLRYNADSLALLRTRLKQRGGQQTVKLKYHPGDLSRIHVYDPFDNQYLPVFALAAAYTQGLSLWQHQIIRRYLLKQGAEMDMVAIAQAKREIQEIVDKAKQAPKLKTHTQIARWDGEAQPATVTPLAVEPSPLAPSIQLIFDPTELEAAGWRTESRRGDTPA